MNLGVIIEVAIGLIFIWLILSLSTIQIQEWVASLLKFREKDLEKSIGQMLANPKLTEEFYNHPFIRALFEKPGKKPAYIPPREFAQALFNIVLTAGTENSAIQQILSSLREKKIGELLPGLANRSVRKQMEETLDRLIEKAGKLVATDTNSIVAQFQTLPEYVELAKITEFKDLIENIPATVTQYINTCKEINLTEELADISVATIEKYIVAIGKINPDLERSLKTMVTGVNSYVTAAEKGLAVARTNVEKWFNSSMERLSGRYKRRSQIITFIIGIFLAVVLSVDSIALVQRLWIDPTVRAALLENASAFKLQNENPADAAATSSPEASDASSANTPDEEVASPADTIRDFQAQFEGLKLPLGWVSIQTKGTDVPTITCALYPQSNFWLNLFKVNKDAMVVQGFSPKKGTCYRPSGTTVPLTSTEPTYQEVLRTNWLLAWFMGILISAAATTQGAPFWFDILNKLINLRGAGTRPPTTTQESTPQK